MDTKDEALNTKNEEWDIRDGLLEHYDGTARNIVIPEGVKAIAASAFVRLNIDSIVFPNSLKGIGKWAFVNCIVKGIILSENTHLEDISRDAFYREFLEKPIETVHVNDRTLITGSSVLRLLPADNMVVNLTGACDVCELLRKYCLGFNGKIKLYDYQVPEYIKAKIKSDYAMWNVSYISKEPTCTIDSANVVHDFLSDEEVTQDTFVVDSKGVLLKYYNVSGKQDIELPYDVKVIDTGVFRDMKLRSVHIPDTVKDIGGAAFMNCGLDVVYLPKGLEKIGAYAFADNNLNYFEILDDITLIDYTALKDNPIETLSIPSYLNIKSNIYPYVGQIKCLFVGNKNSQALETLKRLKSADKFSKITIMGGKALSFKEKREISKMFGGYIKFSYIPASPSYEVEETVEEEAPKETEVTDELDLKLTDEEVKKIIGLIKELLSSVPSDYKYSIYDRIRKLVQDYRRNLSKIKDEINSKNSLQEGITLELKPNLPINLKVQLLIDLESLYDEVKRSQDELAFRKEIEECKKIWEGQVIDKDSPLSNKAKQIVEIAHKCNFESLLGELNELLNETIRNLSNVANATDMQTLRGKFTEDLQNLLNKTVNMQTMYDISHGVGDNDLAKDVVTFKKIIGLLDEASTTLYEQKFEELLNKCRPESKYASIEDFEKNFREGLGTLLGELNDDLPIIEKHKAILNGISRSLKMIADGIPIVSSPTSIESMVKDICDILKNPLFTQEVVNEKKANVIEVLKSQYTQQFDPSVQSQKPHEDNPYYVPDNLEILKKDILLEMEVLKVLASLKLEIEFDLMKLQDVDKHKI